MAHLSEELMLRYVAGSASGVDCISVDTHLADCDACLARVRALLHLRQNFDAVLKSGAALPQGATTQSVHASGTVEQIGPTQGDVAGGRHPPHSRQGALPWLQNPVQKFLGFWLRPRLGWSLAGAAGLIVLGLWFGLAWLRESAPRVALRDVPGELVLTRRGQVLLSGKPLPTPELMQCATQLLVHGAVTLAESVRPAVEGVQTRVAQLGPGTADVSAPTPLQPAGVAVRTAQPDFRWSPVAGAQSYKILLAEQKELLWEYDLGAALRFTPRADTPALLPGRTYSWQVEATVGGELKLSSPARFYVLERAVVEELTRLESRAGNSTVLLAALYQSYGLFDEAQAQLEKAQGMNPHSPLPRQWLAELRRRRGPN